MFVQTSERFMNKKHHRYATALNHVAFYVGNPEPVDRIREMILNLEINELYADIPMRPAKINMLYSLKTQKD